MKKKGHTQAKETGIPISVETCYKFLVLLPLEADNKIEALKHYYGISYTNELIVRGIEIRRHDAPNFIKNFQTELLYTLFDCKDSARARCFLRPRKLCWDFLAHITISEFLAEAKKKVVASFKGTASKRYRH